MRLFSKASRTLESSAVKLRGVHIEGKQQDLPTLIWLPELVEPAENHEKFFRRKCNKITDVRNVWCLNYRNQGSSDHHYSYDLDDMSDDIIRFMDENKITYATIGGHGFGAKVAAVTAINNHDRFTGVIQLEGGPLDHRYYEAYHELKSYVEFASKLHLAGFDVTQLHKKIDEGIPCKKWASIFKQNLVQESSSVSWRLNLRDLWTNMQRNNSDICNWSQSYGLWGGQALAIFAAHSRWVHLSTNTLPFYNVFPRLQGQFGKHLNIHADGFEAPTNHWLHEEPSDEVWYLSQKIWRWLRWHDGAHVLLADKSEAGWYFLPDRGYDSETNTRHGEYTPEHVHHNYLYTDEYEKSRAARGKEGAGHGQFLPVGKFSPEDKQV